MSPARSTFQTERSTLSVARGLWFAKTPSGQDGRQFNDALDACRAMLKIALGRKSPRLDFRRLLSGERADVKTHVCQSSLFRSIFLKF